MSILVRKAVRVLLFNDENELLLMCVEDFDISTPEGKKNKRFWCIIGGGIEGGESIEQTAFREIHEEAGISEKEVNLGPLVWYGNVELVLKGTLTRLEESFIVAKTKRKDVVLHAPTEDEKQVVKKLQWFSLEEIKESQEVIFPIVLPEYLPDVLSGKYPDQPIEINLKAEPKKFSPSRR